MSLMSQRTVTVVGGGIAGMSAAQFLAEAGFEVTLLEAASSVGGRARSSRLEDGHPVEHSMRVFSSAYHVLLTLVDRIPRYEGRRPIDSLLHISLVQRFDDGSHTPPRTPARPPRSARLTRSPFAAVRLTARALWRMLQRSVLFILVYRRRGVPVRETVTYLYKHARLHWMSPARQDEELGALTYGEYLEMERRSPAFRRYFSAIPLLFVAARPDASATAIARMMSVILFKPPTGAAAFSHLDGMLALDGPTSERLIEPWAAYLRALGVRIETGAAVRELEIADGRVSAVVLADGRSLASDAFVLALPVPALVDLIRRGRAADHLRHLEHADRLRLEWSNGIQVFLRALPDARAPCHRPGAPIVHVDSPWAFVSITQADGFWDGVELPAGTRGVISATWSACDRPGTVTGKPVTACTSDEILSECLRQCGIPAELVRGFHLDDQLAILDADEYEATRGTLGPHLAAAPSGRRRMVNFAPLPILLPGHERTSPRTRTELPNLFLAGDATWHAEMTFAVPTMEKAAQSGYFAALEIVRDLAPEHESAVRLDIGDLLPMCGLRSLDHRIRSLRERWRRRPAIRGWR